MSHRSEEAVERTVEQKLQTANEACDLYAADADTWRGRYMELATCIFTVKQIAEASQDDLHAALKSELLKARIDTEALRSQIERELVERLRDERKQYEHVRDGEPGLFDSRERDEAVGALGLIDRLEAALTTATEEGGEDVRPGN